MATVRKWLSLSLVATTVLTSVGPWGESRASAQVSGMPPPPSPARPQARSADDLTPAERSAVWDEMESHIYDAGWERLEDATERAWGEPLDRDKAEGVMKVVEAAVAGDWVTAGSELTEQALGSLPRGMGFYIDALKFVQGELREAIDSWAEELYAHPSYYRLEAMVADTYRDTHRQFTTDIALEDEPFLPSYRIGAVLGGAGEATRAREQQRMRAVEARLFESWSQAGQEGDLDLNALAFENPLANIGSKRSVFDDAYRSRLRQVLGYEPTERQVFNHFYLRITRRHAAEYAANYERVRRRQAAMQAIMARNDAIDAWLALQPAVPPCPPSRLVAGAVGSGSDHSAAIASLQQMTDQARAALITEGVDPSAIPFFPPNRPIGGFLLDNVQVRELPAFSGGRFNGEIVVVLPPSTLQAHFRGRPDSFVGGLRTAEVHIGRSIGTVAPAYFNARFQKAWLTQSGAQVADQPLSIELIGPQYSFRYASTGWRNNIVSKLTLGVSVCLNGERVIDRTYDSGDASHQMRGIGLSGADHANTHGESLAAAIVAILEQALLDLAQTPGFEHALSGQAGSRGPTPTRVAASSPVPDAAPSRLTPQEAFDQLRQLNAWRDEGRLTETQYQQLRDQIMARSR
jgi:hypothetical protein